MNAEEHSTPPPLKNDFVRSDKKLRQGKLMLLGGVVMLGAGVLGFLLVIFHQVDQVTQQLLCGGPMAAAVALLAGGWVLTRGPRRVTIEKEELVIEQGSRPLRLLWSKVGWATIKLGTSHQRSLVIYDSSGRKVASLSEAFEDFDLLVAAVKSRVADQNPTLVENIQMRKARKSALLMGGFAILMLAGAGWLVHTARQDQEAARLLQSDAIEGVAQIDRLFVAPNGINTRVEYTVTNEAGGSRNTEITPAYFAELTEADAKTVPVIYVPSDPSISRLQRGEIIEGGFMNSPKGQYMLSGLVAAMCLVFLGAAALQWKGLDLDLDSKTGKFSIKKFGEGE